MELHKNLAWAIGHATERAFNNPSELFNVYDCGGGDYAVRISTAAVPQHWRTWCSATRDGQSTDVIVSFMRRT